MTTKDFLKPTNFNIKACSLSFESVKYMTDLDKKKIYINFVKLLNNHFKRTLFKKNLYEHFHCHCGFIAHYNIHGFYGEYFETAAKFHFNVNGYSNPMHECSGNLNQSSRLSHGEQFYAIYEEISNSGSYAGLGGFFSTLCGNQNYGAYGDYSDLDDAIKEAFNEYMSIWREKINEAQKAHDKFLKNDEMQKLKEEKLAAKSKAKELLEEANNIEQKMLDTKAKQDVDVKITTEQPSLFDFMAA